jgi:hypothetical protein
MSETFRPRLTRLRARWTLFGLALVAVCPAGCTSMSQDVDAYYRQMAFNYKEAAEKAKLDAVALENETKVLATTGDFNNLKKSRRRLSHVKDWEDKCEKQSERFEKAAEWTEAHFHLAKPKVPDKPAGSDALEDPSVLQASGAKNP